MGQLRRGRFLALTTAGLIAAGFGVFATAQSGVNLSISGRVINAQIHGLAAHDVTISPGHVSLGEEHLSSPIITLHEASISTACLLLRSVDVPFLGQVTLVADLPEGANARAETLVIESQDISGSMLLGGLNVGSGVAPASDSTGPSGVGVHADSLDSATINIDLTGVRASALRTDKIHVRAVTGEGSCT